MIRGLTAALALAFVATPSAAPGQCASTPFACEVDAAIEHGLAWLRGEVRDGALLDPRHNSLGLLALLQRPTGPGWHGRRRGYRGLSPEDRALVETLARVMIDARGALTALLDPDEVAHVEGVGLAIMALSTLLDTGGPHDVGARVTVGQAIRNGALALRRRQGEHGGWSREVGWPDADIETTHFAATALAAARRHDPDAGAALARVPAALPGLVQPDGGGLYIHSSSTEHTAALLWTFRLVGVSAADPHPQRTLDWLWTHYEPDRTVGGVFQPTNLWYGFWALQKALDASRDDGLGGAIYSDAFGERDPAALGYPEEPPSHDFDLSFTLLGWQGPASGHWGSVHPAPAGRNVISSHVYALLTLYRNTAELACPDDDGDGICPLDDVCPDVLDPDQVDADGDGFGDGCDLCPATPDPEQGDADGDGLGDACDDPGCPETPEVCDGIDNDCDTLIDVLPDGTPTVPPAPCEAEFEGRCAVGRMACVAGAPQCVVDALAPAGCEDDAADAAVDPEQDAQPIDLSTAPDAAPDVALDAASDPDAGAERDRGAPAEEGDEAMVRPRGDGCACEADGGGPAPLAALLLVVWAARRKGWRS